MKLRLVLAIMTVSAVAAFVVLGGGTATVTENKHIYCDVTITNYNTTFTATNTTLPYGILRGVVWAFTNSTARTNTITHIRDGHTNTHDTTTGTASSYQWDGAPILYVMPTDQLILSTTDTSSTGVCYFVLEKD